MNQFITAIFKYLLRGLIFCVPIGVTIYVLVVSFRWLDNLIPLKHYPGIGLAIILAGLILIGYLGSSFIVKPLFVSLEKLITKLPLVRIIYSSLKDLISAFVGDKKKFNQPVLVLLNKETELYKLGFITQQNLDDLGIAEKVAVYLPHSYNFSGDLYIVPRANVTTIEASSTAIMKFIVSGGVVD